MFYPSILDPRINVSIDDVHDQVADDGDKCEYIETCPADETPDLLRGHDDCEHFITMMEKDVERLDDSELVKRLLKDEGV